MTDFCGREKGSGNRSLGVLVGALLLGVLCVLSLDPAGAQTAGAVFTVNDARDLGDPNLGDGRCDAEAGVPGEQCTLRAAIINANRHQGPDTVAFALPGEGVRTLAPDKALPTLADQSGPTIIDGYTQPGSSPNADPLASDAKIMVEIRGAGTDGFDGLTITSPGNVVRGLALYDLHKALVLTGTDARENRVVGNFVGTDAAGRFRAPTASSYSNGVHLSGGATRNFVGGTSDADRNVIAGNAWIGVGVYEEGTDANVVSGNLIGLTPAGDARLGNRRHGVDINYGAARNVIGGPDAGSGNVVSGNRASGVEISHGANPVGNRIEGNLIGTDVTGASGPKYATNGASGVDLEDGPVDTLVRGNVIGNNGLGGIRISSPRTRNTTVVENRIGVSRDGSAIRNGVSGVRISNGASDSRIGPGNVIAHSPVGVQVVDPNSLRNAVVGNAIFQTSRLGIDLGPLGQPNANDPRDRDKGANNRQNRPALVRATSSGGKTVVKGKLNSAPRRTYEIQLFSNPRGTNEGRLFIGSKEVTTNKKGTAGFYFYPKTAVKPGRNVTATATDPNGNTSEFSGARRVQRG